METATISIFHARYSPLAPRYAARQRSSTFNSRDQN